MIAAIKKWIAQRKHKARVIEVARDAFRRAYGKKELSWRIPPVSVDEEVYVVAVCFGSTRPPRRSWWLVDMNTQSGEELPYGRASKLIRIPVWR